MTPPKRQGKLDAIINGERVPHKRHIRDYAKLVGILKLYWDWNFNMMAKEIHYYGRDFSVDLSTILRQNFKSETLIMFYFEDIIELYLDRLDQIWAEERLRKEYRKLRKRGINLDY